MGNTLLVTQHPVFETSKTGTGHIIDRDRKPDYTGVLGACCIAFFYLAIRLVLGQDSFITLHDNLDSEIPWRFALANSPDPNNVLRIMNGLPGSFMASRLNLVYLLFEFFEPFPAYVLTEALVHGVAFAGMYCLLQWHFRDWLLHSKLIVTGVSLCFALLPFYTIYGLSVAGQPLLLACFLNLQQNRRSLFSWFYLAVFCFASSFVLSGIFLLVSASFWFALNAIKNRSLNYRFLLGIVLMAVFYGMSEHKLIRLILLKEEISHREAWDLAQMSRPFAKALFAAVQDFLIGQYHVASQHVFMLLLGAFAMMAAWFRGFHVFFKPLAWLFFGLGITALLFGFFQWDAFIPLKEKITLLKTFNLSRFYFLQPLLWHLVFAFALGLVYYQFRNRKLVAAILAVQALFTIGSKLQAENELRTNVYLLTAKLTNRTPEAISYRKFVSEKLFAEIKATIGKPQESYRVVCLGISPGMAQLNGFYTLDSYQNNYPLRYKKAFREIIAPELAKSPKWRAYFDGWGSRCFVFAAESAQNFPENQKTTTLKNFSMNTTALKKLGGKYLISAYLLQNAPANKLMLVRKFSHAEALRPLYLYSVL